MRIQTLKAEQIRLFEQVELEPATGLNWLEGANGAGKSTLLEAIHVLSCGRSFRGGTHESLIRTGASQMHVFASVWAEQQQRSVRLGLERSSRTWSARLDGAAIEPLSRLFQELAVVCFAPDSHVLISGGSESRRRFIDWALFHVEPRFITPWRRYQRALKQRNSLLKQNPVDAVLGPWERELAEHGVIVDQLRQTWLDAFAPDLKVMTEQFLPELGEVRIRFRPGSEATTTEAMQEVLLQSRPRERNLGYTLVGAHRSDWSLGYEHLPERAMFSRGQEKLTVLACLLAQALRFSEMRGEWPVLLLDDLPSELDTRHLDATLAWLGAQPVQTFISTAQKARPQAETRREQAVFHVEHGTVARLV